MECMRNRTSRTEGSAVRPGARGAAEEPAGRKGAEHRCRAVGRGRPAPVLAVLLLSLGVLLLALAADALMVTARLEGSLLLGATVLIPLGLHALLSRVGPRE